MLQECAGPGPSSGKHTSLETTKAETLVDCHACFCEPGEGLRRKAKSVLKCRHAYHSFIIL